MDRKLCQFQPKQAASLDSCKHPIIKVGGKALPSLPYWVIHFHLDSANIDRGSGINIAKYHVCVDNKNAFEFYAQILLAVLVNGYMMELLLNSVDRNQ